MRADFTKGRYGATLVRVAILLAGLSATATAARAQPESPAPTRPELFVDVVDVNLVNVEVIVTRNGHPVTDLGRDDFVILDDGKPVEITNFYAVDQGQEEARGPAEDGPRLEAPAREERAIIVLVDNTFIDPGNRKKVLGALRQRLDEALAGGAQVMVVNKDQELWIEQRFTTDPEAVHAAIDRIEGFAGSSNLDSAIATRVIREIERGVRPGSETGENDARETLASVRDHAEQSYQNVRRTSQLLQRFLGSMSGMPGRKALFYVSDRLPLSPAEALLSIWYAKYGAAYGPDMGVISAKEAALEYDTTGELVELVADAAARRVAFYPIGGDVSPIREALSARNESALVTTSFVATNPEPPDQLGLRFIARGTGGDAGFGIANVDPVVDRMQADFSQFYSLGYPSPHEGDGRTHWVKVLVKKPGVTVRYLDTYRDKSNDQQMSDRMFASLFFGEAKNPLGVALEIGEIERAKKGQYVVPIAVKFPVAGLALVPQEEMVVGEVSIYVISRDRQGRTSQPVKIPVPVRIPSERMPDARAQVAAYATKLAMRGGEQTIAVGVRDEVAGQSSTVNLTLEVGDDKTRRRKHEGPAP